MNQSNSFQSAEAIFPNGGQMGALMRCYDWKNHPLGEPCYWPESLLTGIRMMLSSGYPMFIWWSSELYMFHNDAFQPAFVGKHKEALGARAREVWADIWGQLGSVVEDILANGTTFYAEEMLVVPDRKGFKEETYWTFSYSPMPDGEGRVNGIFCACHDGTQKVLHERRLKMLSGLSDVSLRLPNVESACEAMSQVMENHSADIPFGMIYLVDETAGQASCCVQTAPLDQPLGAPVISLQTAAQPSAAKPGEKTSWPLAKVYSRKKEEFVENLRESIGSLPGKTVDESPDKAVVLPLFKPNTEKVFGFFIAGLSPMLEYDAAYRDFHVLLTARIASLLAIIDAQEKERQQERAQRHRLQNIFEQAPAAIAIFEGPDYQITYVNQAHLNLWGKRAEEVLDKPLFEALPEAKGVGYEELLEGVVQTGTPFYAHELSANLTRNGKRAPVYFNFVYQPWHNQDGRITGVIVVANEITEQVEARKKVEESKEALKKLNEELEERVNQRTAHLRTSEESLRSLSRELAQVNHDLQAANQNLSATNQRLEYINNDLDTFIYTASHDLKAPINNIEGLLGLLNNQVSNNKWDNEYVKHIASLMKKSVARFKRTIEDLTDLTKLQQLANQPALQVNLLEVLQEVMQDIQPQINACQAIIQVEVEAATEVQFYPKNLRSVLYNLLSNALKYRSPERGLVVKINSTQTEAWTILSVEDNGLGLKPAQLSKLFTMFRRFHSHVEGSGVGLFMVKRMVENHGGKIEVKSKAGAGSVFMVYFPT